MQTEQIAINGWNLVKTEELEGHWLTGEEIGKHLGYAEPRTSVRKIYERHQDNFKVGIDVTRVKLTSVTGPKETRIFSERGTLKVIRYSNTAVADAVMDEVFDIYLAVRKLSASGKPSRELPGVEKLMKIEMKASGLCVKLVNTAMKLGATRAQARKKAVEEVKVLTGVDFASIFDLELEEKLKVDGSDKFQVIQEQKNFVKFLEAWYQYIGDAPVTVGTIKLYLRDGLFPPDKGKIFGEAIAKATHGKALSYYLRANRSRIGGSYQLIESQRSSDGIEWQVKELLCQCKK